MKLGNNNETCSFWDSSEMFKQAKVQILNYINNKRNVPVDLYFLIHSILIWFYFHRKHTLSVRWQWVTYTRCWSKISRKNDLKVRMLIQK